jgi:hypothetical protein
VSRFTRESTRPKFHVGQLVKFSEYDAQRRTSYWRHGVVSDFDMKHGAVTVGLDFATGPSEWRYQSECYPA